MPITSFSESLVDIYSIIENKIKKESNKENKLKFIDDSLDWINTLKDLLFKLKKEIEDRK